MSFITLPTSDMQAEALPTERDFYTRFGVANSGVPSNRENLRKGLLLSLPMFKAIEDEFTRRLQQHDLWGKSLRGHRGQTALIVTETIQSLPIPDHVSAHVPSFFMKTLHKLLTLINEAPAKQAHRDAVKRESTESLDARPGKAQKLSRTKKTNSFQLSVLFTQGLPSIKSLQFIITDNMNGYILISVQRLMSDSTITSNLWEQISFEALLIHLRTKRWWGDIDKNPHAPLRFSYQLNNASGYIKDNDDLKEACKYWERVRTPKWRMFLERAIIGLSISLPYANDKH